MNAMGLMNSRRFILTAISMAVLLVVIFSVEIATGDLPGAPTLTTNIASVLCAAIASVLIIIAWRRMSGEEASKRIWGLIALGILLWAVAEATWSFYELVLQVEIPYPSVADVLWLVGYVPLYAALVIRYRSFQSTASILQKIAVVVFMGIYSAVLIYYVAIPLVQGFDSSRLGESVTNIAYPLADWGLCLLAMAIIFSLERGRFAGVWHLFGAGIVLSATADLLYFYAAWNELYYPDGRMNFISGFTDGTFNVSYLLLGLSAYAYWILAEAARLPGTQMVLAETPKMEVLIFLNPQGRILRASDNLMDLLRAPSARSGVGMDLAEALGLRGPQAKELMIPILSHPALGSHPVHFKDRKGLARSAWLTSMALPDEDGKVESIAVVMRTDPPAAGESEHPLAKDQKELIDYYLSKAGTSRFEEDEELRRYFLSHINLLLSINRQYSGASVADKMLEHLIETARFNNWQLSHSGQTLHFPDELSGRALRDLLVLLLEQARDFTCDMTNQRMVEQEMKSLDKKLSLKTLRVLDKYDFRLGQRAATKTPMRSASPA